MYPAIPLLPTPAIDGPWRVDSYGAVIVPSRSYRVRTKLFLVSHHGLAVYGKNQNSKDIVRFTVKQALKQAQSINTVPVNRSGMLNDSLESFPYDLSDKSFTDASLFEILSMMKEYVNDLEQLSRKHQILRPMNKKFDLFIIPCSPGELLSNSSIIEFLKIILSKADRLRITIMLVTENPSDMPREIESLLSWQAFIGETQDYAFDFYGFEEVYESIYMEKIGTSLNRLEDTEYLLALHSLKHDRSELMKNRVAAVKTEADSYMEFLESLSDGT